MIVIGVMLFVGAGGFLIYLLVTKLEAIKTLPADLKAGFSGSGSSTTNETEMK